MASFLQNESDSRECKKGWDISWSLLSIDALTAGVVVASEAILELVGLFGFMFGIIYYYSGRQPSMLLSGLIGVWIKDEDGDDIKPTFIFGFCYFYDCRYFINVYYRYFKYYSYSIHWRLYSLSVVAGDKSERGRSRLPPRPWSTGIQFSF